MEPRSKKGEAVATSLCAVAGALRNRSRIAKPAPVPPGGEAPLHVGVRVGRGVRVVRIDIRID
jgi:hypothetical protein